MAAALASPFDLALTKARELAGGYPAQAFGPAKHGRLTRMHRNVSADEDDRSRIELAAFQYEMYRGNQLAFLEPHPAESEAEFLARPHLRTMNLTRVVIDVLSGLYRKPVERSLFDGSQSWRDLLSAAQREHRMDTLMAGADRMTRLQGIAAIQVLWHDDALKLRLVPAHRIAVIPDPIDPSKVQAVVMLSSGKLWDERGYSRAADFADIWTADEYARVRDGKVSERHAHGYGAPPFVILRDRQAIDGFFVEGRGRSLCYDNAVLNARLSDLAQVVALQGFGVMEIVNPDPAQELKLGPGRALAFRVDRDTPFGVNYKQPGAPIREMVEELSEFIRHILLAQRIPERALSVSVTSNASGLSIQASNSPVLEDRVERATLFRAAEQEIHEMCVRVASLHSGLHAKDAPRLRVNYPEPDLAESLAERREHDEWMLARGLTTPWAIMLRDNPDAFESPEEARAVWELQSEELRKLGVIPELPRD